MKTKTNLLAAGMLLTACLSGFGQPIITNQPQWQTNIAGTTAIFSVGATGAPPLSYQWRKSSSALAGKTNATLLLTNVQQGDQALYSVVITNLEGAVTSIVARLYVLVPPSITTQPMDIVADVGNSANFAVVASPAPLSYQWRFNNIYLVGKTNSALNLFNVQFTNAGDYTVVIANAAGSTTSQVARLAVAPMAHSFHSITAEAGGAISLEMAGSARTLFKPYYDLYPLEASSDLNFWSPLTTLERTNASTDPLTFLDLEASHLAQRFCRTPTNHLITPFPKTTGPYAVGTSSRLVSDPSRTNRYNIPTNSSFMVTFWYPAQARTGALPDAYVDKKLAAAINPLRGGLYWGNPSVVAEFVSPALADLPVATNQTIYPVVIYSHGFTAHRQQNTDKAVELASHGYVVVAMDHIDAFASVLPNGQVVFGTASFNLNLQYLLPFFQSRVKDIQFILDELARVNTIDPLFARRLDLQRIGAFGFSLGGGAVGEACRIDTRCKAVVLLDGYLDPAIDLKQLGLQKPLLSMNSAINPALTIPGYVGWLVDTTNLFTKATNDAFWFQLQGSTHSSFSDYGSLISDPAFTGGPTTASKRQSQVIRACLLSFLDKYLKDEDDNLLDQLTNAYPDVLHYIKK